MKCDTVQENAHIMVMGFWNSNSFIPNKGKEVRFIVKEKYRNSEIQSLRYEENGKAVSERRQEKPSATLYRKILISWSSAFGTLIFLHPIKVTRKALL